MLVTISRSGVLLLGSFLRDVVSVLGLDEYFKNETVEKLEEAEDLILSDTQLFKKTLKVVPSEIHWIREDLTLKNGETMEVMARVRYRQALQKATLHQFEKGLYVSFEEPQSAITEGQFVAWNIDDELVGSGVIS
jgi:tRNA U34 2-thiouridine synthase MnmA/TrmU